MEKLRYDPEKRGGGYAWAALLGGVALYDLVAEETLSNAYARGREHDNPLIRAAVLGSTIIMMGHLLDKFKEEHDPIDNIPRGIGFIGTMVREHFIHKQDNSIGKTG